MPRRRRPKILDASAQGAIVAQVAFGCSVREAARYVGCHESAVRQFAAHHPEFKLRLTRARELAKLRPDYALRKSARHSWRLQAKLLERRCPQQWSRRRRKTRRKPWPERIVVQPSRPDPSGQKTPAIQAVFDLLWRQARQLRCAPAVYLKHLRDRQRLRQGIRKLRTPGLFSQEERTK